MKKLEHLELHGKQAMAKQNATFEGSWRLGMDSLISGLAELRVLANMSNKDDTKLAAASDDVIHQAVHLMRVSVGAAVQCGVWLPVWQVADEVKWAAPLFKQYSSATLKKYREEMEGEHPDWMWGIR